MTTGLLFTPAPPERDPRLAWPSVTRILKLAGLSPWQDVTLEQVRRGTEQGIDERKLRYILQGLWPEVLDAKAEIGRMVHLAAQDIERGMTEAWWEGEEFVGYIDAYLRFKEETDYCADACEELVFNAAYQYRGTLDSRGTMGRYSVLIDIKTTVGMPPDLPYQLAGYDLCLEPNPKRMRFGLQLKRDGSYQLHEYRDPKDKSVFLAAVCIAKTKENGK